MNKSSVWGLPITHACHRCRGSPKLVKKDSRQAASSGFERSRNRSVHPPYVTLIKKDGTVCERKGSVFGSHKIALFVQTFQTWLMGQAGVQKEASKKVC